MVISLAARPLESTTWLACMAVITARCNGNPAKIRKMGREKFVAAVRGELPYWDAKKISHRVLGRVWDALSDTRGVPTQRRGALERVHLVMADWRSARARLGDVQGRMLQVLDQLGLTELVCSIDGLSGVGAAAILAETGDMARFASARSVVKHAGLNPTENTSATMRGQTRVSHRGRPQLRAAAWRAVWGALPHNQVLGAKFVHLTKRDTDRLAARQARAACAGPMETAVTDPPSFATSRTATSSPGSSAGSRPPPGSSRRRRWSAPTSGGVPAGFGTSLTSTTTSIRTARATAIRAALRGNAGARGWPRARRG